MEIQAPMWMAAMRAVMSQKEGLRFLWRRVRMARIAPGTPPRREKRWRVFSGVRRRQDLLFEIDGVRVYDDFAHHPTAVEETIAAMRAKHADGTLWAVFEPYLINRVFSQENFDLVTAKYNEYGALAVFIAAFTPIPYKVFTVAAWVRPNSSPSAVARSSPSGSFSIKIVSRAAASRAAHCRGFNNCT